MYPSCSNKSETNTEQAKQENQKSEKVKHDSVFPPLVTVIENLADSSKPKEIFPKKPPKPQTINIPPNIIPLAVLKNQKGEPIRDKDGKPFIIGEAGGTSSFTNYTTDQGLALDAISCAIMDKFGNLWFGTPGGGVSRYDGKSFTNFTTAQGLVNNVVKSIAEDKMGNIWFGTLGGGVSRYDGKSFTNYTTAQGLTNNVVWCITEDKKGNLWFGTDGGGVSRYAPSAKLRTGSFTNFTTAQGLANNIVLSIMEDKVGNLWFGTYGGGVSRYDPSATHRRSTESFTNFTTAQGLVNNEVWSITEDKTGNLWFGTSRGGVSRYDYSAKLRTGSESFTNFTIAQGLTNYAVTNITEDKCGNIWFGTDGGGVSRYAPSAKLRTGAEYFTNFTTAQGLASNEVSSITEDKMGNLWFGTNGGGVCRYDGKAFTNFTTTQGMANNVVTSISEDKSGHLWFGTDGGGVSRYDGKSFTNYTTAQGLANNAIWCIGKDKKGNLWFSTYDGGVSRYDGNRVEAIETALQRGETIPQRTQQDLKKINGKLVKSFTNYTTAQGLANNVVKSIIEDKMGNIWFGTDGGGVSRYAPSAKLRTGSESFTNFTTAQGLANNVVWCITEDKKGNLWFGTDGGGVSRYDGNRVEAIEAALQRGETIPQETQQDLKKINGKFVKSFTNFTTAQGLANNIVLSIAEDKAGNLWFGTYGGGMSRYDPSAKLRTGSESFMNFTTAQGLPDNSVTQITITKEQNIVIGTNFGVGMLVSFTSKLEGNSVQSSIPAQNNLNNEDLKNYTPVIEIYNSAMGYPVKDVNAGQNAMFADSKGIIWIATGADKTALVRFDYTALHKNKMPPDVFIQSIKINNSTICWHNLEDPKFKIQNSKLEQTDSTTTAPNITEEVTTFGKELSNEERNTMRQKFRDVEFDGITKFYPLPENLVLPHRNNNVTFDFAAIEPAKPYLIHYQYILEGYDNDWSPVTNKTSATFGNIYEGTYTFKLKAQSPFGVWSQPVEYKFTVLPPWWRTWWMYSVYGIAAIALVVLIVWWNGRRLRAKATELTDEVRKATHTITEKQKEIIDSITYAKRIQHAMLPHRKDIWAAFPTSFVLFKPKDIVSGDFYFFNKNNQFAFIAVADCTGHGVPGAFMSVIGSAKLNDAVSESSDTSEILSLLNKGIKTALKQSDSDESTRDGMDIALCAVDINNRIVKYAGANRPIWIVRKGLLEVEEIKATKKAIGGLTENNQHFESHEIKLQQGDTFYICTDGYADQFGGKEGKKLMTKKLKEVLIEIQNKSMKEQEHHLGSFIENWKAGLEQIDDILIIGVRV
ncbi:MAG: two-component regulator propeller domain-containing protein [Bacteroidota bacterium]